MLLVARNVGLSGELYYSHTRATQLYISSRGKEYGLQFGVSVFVY